MAGGPPNLPLAFGVDADFQMSPIGSVSGSPVLAQMEFSSPCTTSSSKTPSPTSACARPITPEGMDCHGNERQALVDLGRFFNCQTLSDVRLRVGGKVFFAHKLVLVNVSDVFERMLTADWQDAQQPVGSQFIMYEILKGNTSLRILHINSMPRKKSAISVLFNLTCLSIKPSH